MSTKLILQLTPKEADALWKLLSEGLHEDVMMQSFPSPAERATARRVATKVARLAT